MTTTAESPILVLGATGGQGGAVTAALLARQARVRAMVRRPGEPSVQRLTERGVEVMVGSLDDRAALGAAMEGAAAVFALTTPFEAGVDAEVAQGRAIVAAADDALGVGFERRAIPAAAPPPPVHRTFLDGRTMPPTRRPAFHVHSCCLTTLFMPLLTRS